MKKINEKEHRCGGVFNVMIRAPRIYYNCFYYTIVVNISYKTQNILKFLSSSCLSFPSTHTHTQTLYKRVKCFFYNFDCCTVEGLPPNNPLKNNDKRDLKILKNKPIRPWF